MINKYTIVVLHNLNVHHHPKTDVDFVSDDEYPMIYFAALT